MRKITKTLAAGGLAVGLGLGGGAAYALWSTSGTLHADGKAATVKPVTINAHVVGEMAPGYYNNVVYRVTNPNAFPIAVEKVSPVAGDIPGSWKYGNSGIVTPSTCTADFQIGMDLQGWSDATAFSVENKGEVVPAGGYKDLTLTDAIGMGSWSTDACQGATIDLPLTVDFTVPSGGGTGL